MERFLETGINEAAFQILEVLQYYIDNSLLGKQPSPYEMQKFGNFQRLIPLMTFLQQQQNYEIYKQTIQKLQIEYDILGLKTLQNQSLLRQLEEEKQLLPNPRENQFQEFSKEDQDLIDIQGDRIKIVEWYFENNDVIKNFALLRQKQKEYMRANINQIHQILPPKNFKFFNDVGYQSLSPEQSKQVEIAYQEYLAKGGIQETFIQTGEDIYCI
ncbi:UNKNOWN [Stylonychia lemnae]|uniref:Uncharacterized protein n=1 Tax=Stylonychia lemnae TaxID=5949 RepID=A0A078ATZ8_STYLE|nr:UNKNOWN [Stylonychia lemnae]|eukprot:CDW85875.1 UNKNOWN [Stylonychia lemnae]